MMGVVHSVPAANGHRESRGFSDSRKEHRRKVGNKTTSLALATQPVLVKQLAQNDSAVIDSDYHRRKHPINEARRMLGRKLHKRLFAGILVSDKRTSTVIPRRRRVIRVTAVYYFFPEFFYFMMMLRCHYLGNQDMFFHINISIYTVRIATCVGDTVFSILVSRSTPVPSSPRCHLQESAHLQPHRRFLSEHIQLHVKVLIVPIDQGDHRGIGHMK